MKLRLFLLSLLSLFFLSSCHHTDIKELVKQLAEQESDTTGYTKTTKHLMPFHAVFVDCFADVTYTQTADETAGLRLASTAVTPCRTKPWSW